MDNYRLRILFVCLLGLIGTIVFVPVASAHANLVRSNPPADSVLPSGQVPGQVQLWFSEQPDPNYSAIRIVNSLGQEVSTGNLSVATGDNQSLLMKLKPNLPDGNYTVIWKTVSAVDGHLVKSAFSFVVGRNGQTTAYNPALDNSPKVAVGNDASNLTLAAVLIRWLNYLAGAMVVGVAGFGLWVFKPTLKRVKFLVLDEPQQLELEQSVWGQLNGLARLGLVGLGIGWVAGLIYQLTQVTGRDWLDPNLYVSALPDFALNSRYGQIWLIRLGLLVLIGLTLNFATAPRTARDGLRTRGWSAVLTVGAAVLLTTSLNAHAAAQLDFTWLSIGADWLHLMATGVWIGGILCLLLVLPLLLQRLTPSTGERTRLLAVLIPHFSQVALASVGVLVVSGVYSSFLEVGTVNALFSTLYGQVLVAKLILFGFVLALATGNLWRISPKMVEWAGDNKAGTMRAGRLQFQFKQAVALEAVLLLSVLLSVGVLTSLEPARATTGTSTQAMVQTAADLRFDLSVSPDQAGVNTFSLQLSLSNGAPVTTTSLVQLRFQHTEMDMGVATVELKPTAQAGFYTATGAILSMVGVWRVDVLVQRSGQNDVSVPFQFKVNS